MSLSNDPEMHLLHAEGSLSPDQNATDHSFRTAPILSGDAADILGPNVVPQRAVYGRILSQVIDGEEQLAVIPKLYINSNAPFSAVVCGLQGSGKSHSTSVLLESCLIQDERLGTLPVPLSAVLFHFDSAAGGGQVQPCEAAFLASLDPVRGVGAKALDVTVLVLPNNIKAMKKVYSTLPNVKVEPLHFSSEDISGERLLAMMKVDEGGQMPLYMELILSILRDMDEFDYKSFRTSLNQHKLSSQQKAMLNLRLTLLDSCLKGGDRNNSVTSHFSQGRLTIIDLSSPFMDPSSACGFFDIILGLFLEVDVETGKLIVLDEAHKYLTDTGSSARLTDSLLTVIRQQRHLNTRVVISTQEPTVVPPKFLELSSFVIAHRFSSPQWLQHLSAHVSAAQATQDELFSKIVALQTGQAIVFAPSGLGVKAGASSHSTSFSASSSHLRSGGGFVAPFGQGYLLVRSRQRITLNGGHSLLAVPNRPNLARVVHRICAPGPPNSDGRHSSVEQSGHIFEAVREFVDLASSTGIEELRSNHSESGFETCADEEEEDVLDSVQIGTTAPAEPQSVDETHITPHGTQHRINGLTTSPDLSLIQVHALTSVKDLSPRACHHHYLNPPCPDGDLCRYAHNYQLSEQQRNEIAHIGKFIPCALIKKGEQCPHGDACYYGHSCPHGPDCPFLSKCQFKKYHPQPAIPAQITSVTTNGTPSPPVVHEDSKPIAQAQTSSSRAYHPTASPAEQPSTAPTGPAPETFPSLSPWNPTTTAFTDETKRFIPLLMVLGEEHASGKETVPWPQAAMKMNQKAPGAWEGKFRKYVDAAIAERLVVSGRLPAEDWMKVPNTPRASQYLREAMKFHPLVQILRDEKLLGGKERVKWSDLAFLLSRRAPNAFTGKLKKFLEAAAEAKLVVSGVGAVQGQEWIALSGTV